MNSGSSGWNQGARRRDVPGRIRRCSGTERGRRRGRGGPRVPRQPPTRWPGEPGRRRGAELCNRLLHNCRWPFAAGWSGRKLCSRSLHNFRGFLIAGRPDPSNCAMGTCTIPSSPRIVPPKWVPGRQGLRKSRHRRTEPGLDVQSRYGVRGIDTTCRPDPERWIDRCTRRMR